MNNYTVRIYLSDNADVDYLIVTVNDLLVRSNIIYGGLYYI